MKIKVILLTAMVLPFAQACSFSTSSESISASSGSFSDSVVSVISSGSSSEKDTKDYQIQVMNYTRVYFTSTEFDSAIYNKGISVIAEDSGITNWEDDADTLNGIGKGLKKAKITGGLYEAYKSSISTNDVKRMGLIQKGYDSQD
jgi:hypothetical protein